MAENKKMTEQVRQAKQAMEQNQSTAQRGNQNSGLGRFPKSPERTQQEFDQTYNGKNKNSKDLK